ncbi:hypothetical protein B005_3362 [Nocardiopsis alba ATCC BAA-2165]|uniref:Uncharacterized protein n=1 Tax=Nocardiopsis alba (strain ATCC BAA-2165 / BE74) TaxID=1205910 RepID=J7LEB3_NOCAA|nr:hypothetical protein B005_3362 [Nocardiopsis alba ATCC BAA-2165]
MRGRTATTPRKAIKEQMDINPDERNACSQRLTMESTFSDGCFVLPRPFTTDDVTPDTQKGPASTRSPGRNPRAPRPSVQRFIPRYGP